MDYINTKTNSISESSDASAGAQGGGAAPDGRGIRPHPSTPSSTPSHRQRSAEEPVLGPVHNTRPPGGPAGAGTPAGSQPEGEPDPDGHPDPGEGSEVEGSEDGGQDDATRKARREAQSLRNRAKAAEADRDRAEGQLLELLLDAAGLSPKLWAAAAVEVPRDDDGRVDVAAFNAAAAQVRAEFGLGRPAPVKQQGQAPGNGGGPTGLAAAFQPRPR